MNNRAAAESARRVSDCVGELLRTQPFFGSLALRLPLVPDSTRKTLGCDGKNIRYSPRWIAETDAHLVATAIARVVLACALKHHTRRDEKDPERWQRASQLVTHGMLRDAGFTLPDDAEVWEEMSVEEAYNRLPEPEPEDGGSGQSPPDTGMEMPESAGGDDGSDETEDPDSDQSGNSDQSDDSDQSGQSGQSDNPDDSGGQDDSGDQNNSGVPDDANDRDDSGDSGNTDNHDQQDDTDRQDDTGPQNDPNPDGSDDNAEPEAQQSHDPSGTGEVMDSFRPQDQTSDQPGSAATDETLKNEEEKKWDEAMHQALSIAKAEGKAPGQVSETIRDAHAGTLDWRTLLRQYMVDAVKRDYSWSVPNRRFIDGGLYLPSIRTDGIESIAVIIDTSASIWCRPQILEMFWSEVRQVVLDIQPEEVIVLQVDTVLQDIGEYSMGELPGEIELKGRGGTDFRPGFAWLEEQGKQPGVCLYLTDMECTSYPDTEPQFSVLWINWADPPADWHREPWGERIDISGF